MKHLILILSILFFVQSNFLHCQTTGLVDTTYNTYNIDVEFSGFDDLVKSVIPLPNGKYLVAGFFQEVDGDSLNRIARLNNDGTVDASFNVAGAGFDNYVYGMKQLINGNYAVWGGFSTYNNQVAEKVAIINSNGNLIYGFNNLDTVFTYVEALDEFSNGDLAIAGFYSNPIPNFHSKMFRYSQQGVRDTSFDSGIITDQGIREILINYNDDVFISGRFNAVNGQQQYCIAKFDSIGVLDSTFNLDFQPSSYLSISNMIVPDMYLLMDSSILISTSNISSIGGTACSNILKLRNDGSLDITFIDGANSLVNHGMVESASGTLYIGGRKFDSNGVEDSSYLRGTGTGIFDYAGKLVSFGSDILRRNIGGELDATFRQNKGVFGRVNVVEPLPDGRYYLGGTFTSVDKNELFGVARMMQDGTVDPTFDFNPGLTRTFESSIFPTYVLNDIDVQSDGKLLLAGEFDMVHKSFHEGVVRLNQDGSLDTTFKMYPTYIGELLEVSALDNGKVLVFGEAGFSGVGNGLGYSSLIRLNSDGSLDSSFQFDYTVLNSIGQINDVAFLPSGKIALLVSYTWYYAQPSDPEIFIVNSDGSIDQNYNNSTDLVGTQNKISYDSQGNLIIALSHLSGPPNTYGGVEIPNLIKISPSGALLTQFAPAIDSLYDVKDFLVLPNDQIVLVYGDSLIRLNTDGSRDYSFLGVAGRFKGFNVGHLEFVAATGDIIAGAYGNVSSSNNYTPGIFRFETDYSTDCSNRDLVVEHFSDITCSNAGALEIKALNYQGDIMYSWDNGPYVLNDTLFTTTVPGPHYLSVYDTAGCSVNLAYIFSGSPNQYAVDDRLNLSPGSFRPGFPSSIDIVYQNDGCLPSTGEVRLVLDSLLSYSSAWIAPDQINGDTLIWNYTSINNDSLSYANRVFVGVSLQAQIGDFVYLTASMNGAPDVDSTNNSQIMIGPVINGYDPNDKSVYPIGECTPHFVEEGQKFTYTIRFQNTGNAEAVNIHIDDTLSPFLDPNSVRVIASSHDMYTELLGSNLLRFKFDSIMLIDSLSSPEGSKGYVIFEVDHIAQVFDETYIDNQVGIYFDFNPAVITNTVYNTIKTQGYLQAPQQMSLQDCDSVYWEGDYYNQAGVYEKTYSNIYGCDSTLVLDLNLSHSIELKDTVAACNEFYWPETGQVYGSSGEYQAIYSAINGCDSILTLNLDITEVDYNIGVASDGSLFPIDSLLGSTYQWFNCDSNYMVLPNETNATYLPAIEGMYSVQIVNGACSDTSSCFLVDYLSTQNFDLNTIEVYPNPVHDDIKVRSKEPITSLRVINNLGQQMGSAQPNSREYIWDVTNFTPGVYLLQITSATEVKTVRVIKN